MLGAQDLLQLPKTGSYSPGITQRGGSQTGPIDYNTIRAEIEENRALKYNADSLIEKYIVASQRVRKQMMKGAAKQGRQHSSRSNRSVSGSGHGFGKKTQQESKRRSFQDNPNVIAETPDSRRSTQRGTRSRRAAKGVVMAKPDPKAAKRTGRKPTSAKKMRKKALANSSKRVRTSNANATSPGSADRIFVSKRSSIRPSELDDIRTYPKKEVEIIRRSHKTKPKSGPTEIYDKRTKSKEARFVGDQTAFNEKEKRGLVRDSEKLLGLSSVSQKLTILADTRESSNPEESQIDRDGPSPRFLRPQPTAQSVSPGAARVHYPQQSNNNPSATMLRQETSPQQILQPSTLPPKIIYQQLPPPQPTVDPDFVRETNEKLAKAEEMVKKLTTQTSLLETTNAALKSQLLSQESRVLEIERRERYETDRKQQLEHEKRLREEEAKVAALRLQDAEKAKEDAISIVKTLESANKNLQKGCEALQDQMLEHQKRADRANMVSIKLREASYQQKQKLLGQNASALATKLAHDLSAVDNFDDLCEVLVTELLLENLGLPKRADESVEVSNQPKTTVATDSAPATQPLPTDNTEVQIEEAKDVESDVQEKFSDSDGDENYDEDDFDDDNEAEVAVTAGKLQAPEVQFDEEVFTKRLHTEINKLRDDLAKDVEMRQKIAEERFRRQDAEDRVNLAAEREVLLKRAAEAEAALRVATEREKYLEKLNISTKHEMSLQQKLQVAEAKAQFMEMQMKKQEDEELRLKEKLALEGERADTFALAATRAAAQQPWASNGVGVPPPPSPESREQNVVDKKENDDDVLEETSQISETEEEPRAYTILYARPNDDVLYTKYGDLEESGFDSTQNFDDSHYNTILSDHSYAKLTHDSALDSEESSMLDQTSGTDFSAISGADSILNDSSMSDRIADSSTSDVDPEALSVARHLLDGHSAESTVMPVGSAQQAAIDDMISAAVGHGNGHSFVEKLL